MATLEIVPPVGGMFLPTYDYITSSRLEKGSKHSSINYDHKECKQNINITQFTQFLEMNFNVKLLFHSPMSNICLCVCLICVRVIPTKLNSSTCTYTHVLSTHQVEEKGSEHAQTYKINHVGKGMQKGYISHCTAQTCTNVGIDTDTGTGHAKFVKSKVTGYGYRYVHAHTKCDI